MNKNMGFNMLILILEVEQLTHFTLSPICSTAFNGSFIFLYIFLAHGFEVIDHFQELLPAQLVRLHFGCQRTKQTVPFPKKP